MALRLLSNGHRCIGYDPSPDNRGKLIQMGGEVADSLKELVTKLPKPGAVWVMVPAGDATKQPMFNCASC